MPGQGIPFPPVSDGFTAFDQGLMRSKAKWASAIALAATVFSAQGSGAATSDFIPIEANKSPPVIYIAEPIVQALPAEEAPSDAEARDEANAASLVELVAAQSTPGKLDRQMHCLASAIYFEARGESLEGQLAVGRVIVNRANSGRFPASYCGVVLQRSQFSFVRGNRMPKAREKSEAWRRAVAIANIAVKGGWSTPAKGALFFHATSVSPGWRLTRLAQVDNHIFYR